MHKVCGIYEVVCLANDKIYVGSSKDIYFRFRRHIMFLRNNKHINQHLQNAFNKYGRDSFVLRIIETCEIEDLIERENFWIHKTNCLNKSVGFNKRDGASGGTTISGDAHYLYGKTMPEETRKKISESKRGKCGGENHASNKLTWKDVNNIRSLSLQGFSNKELAKKYNIHYSHAWRIITNKSWSV